MLKKILMTAAAALAITAGATTLSASDANARGRVSINPSGGDVGRGYKPKTFDRRIQPKIFHRRIQPKIFHRRFSCRFDFQHYYAPDDGHRHGTYNTPTICY